MVERSIPPTNSAMSWLFGSDGVKVPIPVRCFSEKTSRSTRTSSTRFSDRKSTRLNSSHSLHDVFRSQAPVGDIQLAVEPVGPGIALHAHLADGREIDPADQLRDVLALRVGRGEGADTGPVLFGEDEPLDAHLFDPVLRSEEHTSELQSLPTRRLPISGPGWRYSARRRTGRPGDRSPRPPRRWSRDRSRRPTPRCPGSSGRTG